MLDEFHRFLIPPPGKVEPYDGWKVPHPVLPDGTRVTVTAYNDEAGNVLERWLLSETDERWYRVERYSERWVNVRVTRRTPFMEAARRRDIRSEKP